MKPLANTEIKNLLRNTLGSTLYFYEDPKIVMGLSRTSLAQRGYTAYQIEKKLKGLDVSLKAKRKY